MKVNQLESLQFYFLTNNLFPRICRSSIRYRQEVKDISPDWETPDGTCIRDYIHVMDLADAHISALDY